MTAPAQPRFTPVTEKPWAALLAICVGFFMILVDMTIVAVAQPEIKEALDADVNQIVWVSSAYLLAYAVPMLVAGRLGDIFGPKRIFQIGLVLFTAASVWCGLSASINELIAARAVQGLGAALITPQTMALITRIFPPEERGKAMGVWGAVAGIGMLTGPLLGGILTDSLGWEWIYFVNLPIGVIGLVLATILVPDVETNDHRLDWIGVLLSGIGLTALVFGLQEGQENDWSMGIWALIVGGVVVLGLFVLWEAKTRSEPLVPLSLFRDRNFTLSSFGIAATGFAMSGTIIPLMFFLQFVGGMSPMQSALMIVPMAVLTGVFAAVLGRVLDRGHPRPVIATSLFAYSVGTVWLAWAMSPATPVWQLLLPISLIGAATGGIFAPLSATATRNLPWHQAGAGAGVFNTTRVVGSVIGTAAVGALMMSRLAAEFPGWVFDEQGKRVQQLPGSFRDGFASAMGDSLLLPAAILILGAAAAMFMVHMKAQAGLSSAPLPVEPEHEGAARR